MMNLNKLRKPIDSPEVTWLNKLWKVLKFQGQRRALQLNS